MRRLLRQCFFLAVLAFVMLCCTGKNVYAAKSNKTQTSSKAATETKESTTVKTVKTPDDVDKERIVLDRPVITCTERTASKVRLAWKEVKRATRYYVYRSKEKDGKYKLIGSTKKLAYTDKTVKSGKTYYYKIFAAGKNKKGKRIYSKYSKILEVTTKKKVKKTAYVGDSVMSGLAVYSILSGSGKKCIYKVGCSAYSFYNGKTMDELLDYNPDRMYIMLGMNSLEGSPSDTQLDKILSSYKAIIQECLEQNPDLQVIVLPVSPTRPSASVSNKYINKFNEKLKAMAENLGLYYYDYTSFLKDTDGSMKKSYSARDGIHWTKSAYRVFLDELDTYGEKLD